MTAPRPYNLVAELTYHCPLRCAYCSNPLGHADVRDGLDAGAWGRVFREAVERGVVHVGLTGGEPTTRRDLDAIVAGVQALLSGFLYRATHRILPCMVVHFLLNGCSMVLLLTGMGSNG